MTTTRLLQPSDLPSLLWDVDGRVLILPDSLAEAYTTIIDRADLRTLASSRNRDDPPVGGISQEHTNKHLAQAFDGSAARAMLALLDPHNDLGNVSNTFIEALAGDAICVVDAPCGAGATTYAFMSAIATLRAEGILPRIPLDVTLVGADLSTPARVYAGELLSYLKVQLEEQAIFISETFMSWDATDAMSTTQLNRKIIELSANGLRRLVIVSNFSGFLQRAGKRKDAEPHLNELFRYASGLGCAALWIEPRTNPAVADGGLFQWLFATVKDKWSRFTTAVGLTDQHCFTSEARFREPLDTSRTPSVRIAVMPIRLEAST